MKKQEGQSTTHAARVRKAKGKAVLKDLTIEELRMLNWYRWLPRARRSDAFAFMCLMHLFHGLNRKKSKGKPDATD
jgi:hypothetical protein